jgi:protein TonB
MQLQRHFFIAQATMKILWLVMLAVAARPARAQAQKAAAAAPAAKAYTYVEEMPQPPGGGGNAAMVLLIQKEIHLPPFCVDSIVGSRVMVEFTVTKTGTVRNVRIRQSIDSRIDTAVVRAVQSLPRFTPGRQRGVPVNVSFTVPITFHWQ